MGIITCRKCRYEVQHLALDRGVRLYCAHPTTENPESIPIPLDRPRGYRADNCPRRRSFRFSTGLNTWGCKEHDAKKQPLCPKYAPAKGSYWPYCTHYFAGVCEWCRPKTKKEVE
jgi:hypothetical protein